MSWKGSVRRARDLDLPVSAVVGCGSFVGARRGGGERCGAAGRAAVWFGSRRDRDRDRDGGGAGVLVGSLASLTEADCWRFLGGGFSAVFCTALARVFSASCALPLSASTPASEGRPSSLANMASLSE